MWRLIIFPTEESDAQEVLSLIKAEGRKAIALPGDLREEAFCQKLVADAVSALDGLDILVSNAGRQQAHSSILDITTEQFDWTIKTNIYAPFWIIKAALPHLQPGSVIIGTTSEQAYDPSPDVYDYAQTKAATMNYVKSLAKQLGPKGIRVNGVAPGPIWTPLQVSGGASQEKLKKIRWANATREAWTTGRTGLDLCSIGCKRCQLCHRTSLRFRGRIRAALTSQVTMSSLAQFLL
jgi:NAD(P)-dependent dehydrogenase (short-subunit alcohol dehydrogenase family)